MTDNDRVIVIGAGHNGLVCAAYLARAGRRVLVLEASADVGGAAVTREFAPGFRVSAGAHLLYLLDAEIRTELGLDHHGLSLACSRLRTVALAESGSPLVMEGAEIVAGEVSAADRAALSHHAARMQRFAAVIGRQHSRPPPRLAWQGWNQARPAAQLALDLRRLGRKDLQELLRIVASNIHDILADRFESPQLKGALALDAVLGTHAGPRSGNTVLTALHRMSGAIDGRPGAVALPRGGMGAVSASLAVAAGAAGAEIRTGAVVEAILLNGDRVRGVRLAGGDEICGSIIVSNADPKTTFMKLLGARHLEAGFARQVNHIRARGTAAKVHLALTGLPQFRGLAPALTGERLLIAPDPDYVERAFNPAKYREFSPEPVMEISIPSVHDPSLAPGGKHVLSAVVQYAPHDLAGGWENARERFLAVVLSTLERYAPGIGQQVQAAQVVTPADLECEFRMVGGDWHHGEFALDRFLMLRPVPGAARYATPVGGLYLCGAGCHPGGGVMGHGGRNAARVILKGVQAA